MRARIRAGLSYANVMATIAVFLALGGGAYAAMTLPKNSVGRKQLKTNAVVSSKVKNRSLLAHDFKSGQLPRGPRGAPATSLWAIVGVDGLVLAGTALDATEDPTFKGLYAVRFDRDVSHCAAVGTPGGASGFNTTDDHSADARLMAFAGFSARGQKSVHEVQVIVRTESGQRGGFSLAVFC
jgi:hypothetical protein